MTKEFHRPETWSKAHQLLNRSDVHTVPLTVSPRPTALNDRDADAFVDLEKLSLQYIQIGEDNRVHIGAMTTLQDLYLSDLIKTQASGILSEAAYLSATHGLRNLASIAGTLTDPENPPDVPLVLLSLDSIVTVQKEENQIRLVALHEWMKDCNNVLLPGEVILEVSFPMHAAAKGALVRVSLTPRDKAIVAVAAVLSVENAVCSHAGLALAGSNPTVVRLLDAESLLRDKALSVELFDQCASLAEKQADPIGNYRGSVAYRTAMASVLTRRALHQAYKA
ncbi:MAG: FAD binding domain-containing protein [Anaerolineaceae bacterium]|nr:FAD binding domain-containing protein [Anaerolineaceae bacterium]